jgi:hypothetical protein
MQFFDETRTMVAAQGVGIAKGACERALTYAQEREQFGQSISEFQAIQHKLADMHTKTEAARNLTYKSAWSINNEDEQLTSLASMAKEYASRVAVDVADEAVQVHGGAGYVNDFDVERFHRDAKITQIYEGTTGVLTHVFPLGGADGPPLAAKTSMKKAAFAGRRPAPAASPPYSRRRVRFLPTVLTAGSLSRRGVIERFVRLR